MKKVSIISIVLLLFYISSVYAECCTTQTTEDYEGETSKSTSCDSGCLSSGDISAEDAQSPD
jgi:hypothetical protein